jgi:hypothetical protein
LCSLFFITIIAENPTRIYLHVLFNWLFLIPDSQSRPLSGSVKSYSLPTLGVGGANKIYYYLAEVWFTSQSLTYSGIYSVAADFMSTQCESAQKLYLYSQTDRGQQRWSERRRRAGVLFECTTQVCTFCSATFNTHIAGGTTTFYMLRRCSGSILSTLDSLPAVREEIERGHYSSLCT